MNKHVFWTGLIIGGVAGYAASYMQNSMKTEPEEINQQNNLDNRIKREPKRKKDSNELSKRINNLEKTLQQLSRKEI